MKSYTSIYRIFIIMMSFSLLWLLACNKDNLLDPNDDTDNDEEPEELVPRFKVSGYTIADAVDTDGNPKKRVTFQLEGPAEVIDLYSGDIGGNFEYRDGRVQQLTGVNLSFQAQYVEGAQKQPESFAVLASTNFNGGSGQQDVEAATWIDITSRYTFTPGADGTWLPAGTVNADIVDVVEEGKPLYLALRHTTRDMSVYGTYSTFRVRNWLVTSTVEGRTPQIVRNGHFDPEDVRFYHVLTGLWRDGRNVIRAADLTFRGNHGTLASHPNEFRAETVCWAISPAITVASIISGADLPVVVKTKEDDPIETVSFDYNGSGEYRATFLVSNGGAKRIVQTAVTIP